MHRARCIGDSWLKNAAHCLNSLGAIADIVDIVEGVEHTEDVDAIALGGSNKVVDDVF